MEAEIKALIDSSKIRKLLKEKLIAFGCKKDNEFNSLQADICRLKTEYNEKSKSIEKSIVEIQNDDKYVMFSNRVISLEEKITELQRSFFEFKTEFSSKSAIQYVLSISQKLFLFLLYLNFHLNINIKSSLCIIYSTEIFC